MTLTYPSANASQKELGQWCLDRLSLHEKAVSHDPLTNSVSLFAYEIFEALRAGTLNEGAIETMIEGFCNEALFERASVFGERHADASINQDTASGLLAPLKGASFDEVRAHLERTGAGIVFTAHPTFALSAKMRAAVSAFASAEDNQVRDAARQIIESEPHAPDPVITLNDEHHDALKAITRAKAAMRQVTTHILEWAQENYPADWTALTPATASIASWVGYDLDGRTDIHWGETIRIRLEEKALQLEDYAAQLEKIDLSEQNTDRDELAKALRSASGFAREQAVLFTGDLDDAERVTNAANTLTKDDPRRLTSLQPIVRTLDDLIANTKSTSAKLALVGLKSEMKNYGLGFSRIHLRINAAQVRSALRADLGVEDGRGFLDRTTLATAAKKAASVSTRRINIASIFLEQMTARRQLMLCAEFLKHIDEDAPIRFLIAECEAPATVMGAVYLARLYGVDHRLDISPLFETPEAMERGGRFIERLLAEDEFVDYIKKRGRIAVQIGFSDSGRFMGQVAANLSIERLQILLARALAEKNIRDVEVVIFNTHGESMGRGAFPGTFEERFDYLITPWTRARFAHENLHVNIESSFQGGDGYLHFGTDELAAATVSSMLSWRAIENQPDREDRYYSDINYSWDLYRSIKLWQETLFDDADYQIAVGAFAPNLLFTTGSRKVRRQSGASITGPRSLRAIPHNAILQQLAAPANVFGGIGHASGAETDRLIEHVSQSGRMQQIVKIAERARSLTSLPTLRAYAKLFSASFWVSKAARDRDLVDSAFCEDIALRLRDNSTSVALQRLADHFSADLLKLDRVLVELNGDDFDSERREDRRAMHALHSLRLALIMNAFMLTASLPSFSRRHDIDRKAIFEMAFELRFEELASLLEDIFPTKDSRAEMLSGVEEESDDFSDGKHGYPEIHRDIIEPLKRIHFQIREIGVGLSHYYGAYG